ncbi:Dienelactone hydrolase and related enzyme [Candidatus Terasakiella magnetica]|nr:Dienelactone hydrolase and related enzyme [Candidatus Terasakiella magnetica]
MAGRRFTRWGLCALLLTLASPTLAANLIIEDLALTITPPGQASLRLEAVVVRPDDGQRHPLAIINHGAPRDPADRPGMTARTLIPQAQEFARRGWTSVIALRRGYGTSEGSYAESSGPCNSPDYVAAGRASASDLRQIIAAASALPSVDPSKVISVGISAGGLATVALTADPPANLVAAISFAGGRGSTKPDSVCSQDLLVRAFATFGQTSRVPMLWVYAENDHFFNPALAAQFHAAFTKAGGIAYLEQTEAFGTDGHQLFSLKGIPVWTGYVDSFLRQQGLRPRATPLALDEPRVAPPPRLAAKNRDSFEEYLQAPPHKAFVMDESGAFGWRSGRRSVDDAVEGARERCGKFAKSKCRPVMIENQLQH